MDIQELPAIRGGRKREYKISLIHLRTRMKYSEIVPQMTSRRVAAVWCRGIARRPPCHLVITDNALVFTMASTRYPERQTTFERTVTALGLRHWRIARRSPWQNGIIERSHRTDNEACFHQHTFSCSAHRRYQHRLWELYYHNQRPHQSLHGASPRAVLQCEYPLHAAAMGALT